MSLPELQQNPLVQRVIEIFDEDGNGEVDFKGQLGMGPMGEPHVAETVLKAVSVRSQPAEVKATERDNRIAIM